VREKFGARLPSPGPPPALLWKGFDLMRASPRKRGEGRPPSQRFRRHWTMVLMAGLLIGTGCSASASPAPAKVSTVHTVAGGQSNCPPDQAQDLTFTGSFAGHLTCQATPTFCHWDPPPSPHLHLSATIPVVVDGKPATFSVSPGLTYAEPGQAPATYVVPNSSLGLSATQFDLQLADMSNWLSRGGGSVSVVTDDGKRVRGTLDGTLDGTSSATVSGRWACVRQSA
jgi:hypothetical protein